jgi:hypothetical protein
VGSECLLATCFTLASYSTYSLTLKMEAICSSETSVDFQRTTQRYIPEESTLKKSVKYFGTDTDIYEGRLISLWLYEENKFRD